VCLSTEAQGTRLSRQTEKRCRGAGEYPAGLFGVFTGSYDLQAEPCPDQAVASASVGVS
jgi:hypothetical protein